MENCERNKDETFKHAMSDILEDGDIFETMNNDLKASKKVGAFGGYFVIAMLYIMICLYGVIRSLNYGKWLEGVLVENLLVTTGVMILVAAASWMLCLYFDCEQYSLKGFLAVALLLIMYVWIDSEYLHDALAYCLVDIENRWVYELIILPVNAIFMLKLCMAIEAEWAEKNNMMGLLCFIAWNVFLRHISTMLYMSYQGSLIVTNALIFGAVVFTARTEKRCLGNRIAILGLYVGAMFLFLYLKKDEFVSITNYLFGQPGWDGYVNSVRNLFSNVKWIGPAYTGISLEAVDLLKYSANPLQSISAYWGMVPAAIYFAVMIIIMIIFGVTVYRIREDRVYFAVGVSAFANMLMRLVFGTLFSLALFPLQIEMPFAADKNFIFDFCSCAILLMIYFKYKSENGYIGPFWRIKSNLFQKMVDFFVLDEDDDWEEIENDEEIW